MILSAEYVPQLAVHPVFSKAREREGESEKEKNPALGP